MKKYIVTEDGVQVGEGDRVYNYYDMWPGVIQEIKERDFLEAKDMTQDIWVHVQPDHGQWALLNGQRICTIEFARMRGFRNAR